VPVFIEGVCSVLGCKIWAQLKHSKTLENTSGLFGRPDLAGLESKKHPKTRWVGVDLKHPTPLAFCSVLLV
jgi:hypothetical protein